MGSPKKVVTGYNYFGSFAQAIAIGPATRLTRITNGETEIWIGDVDQTSRDGDGKTTLTTSVGKVHWYWGRTDQLADPLLSAAAVDFGGGPVALLVPAWRNVIYFVAEDIAWGSQPVPPVLKFEFERQIAPLTLSAHHFQRDALVPEVIYELLTETKFGAAIPTADLNTLSFSTSAETVLAEQIGVSPQLDESTTVREFIGLLINYVDGYLRYYGGQIYFGLIRHESTAGLPTIDESKLASEPQPSNTGWGDTWNLTRAVFTDRENDWEESAVEVFDDVANAVVTGERTDEELQLSFVTRRAVAKILVKRKGIKGGMPLMEWQLEVLPSLRTLQPGGRIFLTYAKLGLTNRLMRILEVGRDAGDNKVVKLTVQEERTRDESNDYVIPTDDFRSDPTLFVLASTTPRLATLPSGLLDGFADGFLLAAHRPNRLTTGFTAHFTWDPVQSAYAALDVVTSYPFYGTLSWWTPARIGTSFIFRVAFQNTTEAGQFVTYLQSSVEMYVAIAPREWKSVGSSVDEQQVASTWLLISGGGYLVLVSATVVEFEATSGAFASIAPALETLAGNGVYPPANIYMGRRADFMIHQSNSLNFARAAGNQVAGNVRKGGVWTAVAADTDWKRYLKATTFNVLEEQLIGDTTAAVYDRNDTTMSPEGTFTVAWGARVPTLAERYDRLAFGTVLVATSADDTATLNTVYFTTIFYQPTDAQFIVGDETDQILGVMILNRNRWYNKV